MVNTDPYSGLVNDEKRYGSKFQDHLLDQYRLYVEMADNVSERRASSNRFFLTVNTFLLSGLGVASGLQVPKSNILFSIFAAAAGIAFCIAWIEMVGSYRRLNRVKFDIIGKIESNLPAALYGTEWRILTTNREKMRHRPLTEVEKWVPTIFILMYFLYAGATVLAALW
jgi:hypothetical protein